MNIAGRLLRLLGWKVSVTVPDYPKAIICVAPHTSNLDFLLGKLAYASVGRRAGFLMKETWFFWPLGPLLRRMGGVAVPRSDASRSRTGSLTALLVDRFRHSSRLVLAITPEGTRSRTDRWHTGFLRIASEADVPIVLGVIDYAAKEILVHDTFTPLPSIHESIEAIKAYYRPFAGRHPEKFSTGPQPPSQAS